MFDGLLCDLDGTLLNSEPWHKRAELAAFSEVGVPVTEAELLGFTGRTLDSMLAEVNERHAAELTREAFLAVQQPRLCHMIDHQMEPFSDAVPFLMRMREFGLPMWIVTSSSAWYVQAVRSRFLFLDEFFDGWVCGQDVTQGKPHPEPYQLGMTRAGINRPLAVEDSKNGVRAARSAGALVAGIDRGLGQDLEGAHLIVRCLDQLLNKR